MAIKHIDQDLWDKFVDGNPNALLFHKWEFLKLAEKYTGYEFLPCGIYKGDQLCCLFPLFYKKFLGIKMLFSPPPQSGIPYLGMVLDQNYEQMKQDKKESYVNFISEEIQNEIDRIAPNYFSAVLTPGFLDIRPFLWRGYQVVPCFTYTIDLNPEPQDILKGFSSICRQNIRKGEDLKCRLQSCDDTSILTDLLVERYKDQGLNHSVDPAYLKEAISAYPDNLILNCLYDQEELIGATLIQAYNVYMAWMGLPKPKDKKYTYVNESMIWQLILQAKSMGFSKLEISGANKQNLCQYRSKFNPQLECYFTILKKDLFGSTAEQLYLHFVKKNFWPSRGK